MVFLGLAYSRDIMSLEIRRAGTLHMGMEHGSKTAGEQSVSIKIFRLSTKTAISREVVSRAFLTPRFSVSSMLVLKSVRRAGMERVFFRFP